MHRPDDSFHFIDLVIIKIAIKYLVAHIVITL